MTMFDAKHTASSISSGIGNDLDAIKAFCRDMQSEARLQQYCIEQQQREIQALKEKVETLELHKATQLGQDKIIGFLVGAIVLSLLSLVTSIFFSPSEEVQASFRPAWPPSATLRSGTSR